MSGAVSSSREPSTPNAIGARLGRALPVLGKFLTGSAVRRIMLGTGWGLKAALPQPQGGSPCAACSPWQ